MLNKSAERNYPETAYKLIAFAVLCTTFRGIIGNYIGAFTYLADFAYILILFLILFTKGQVTNINKSIVYHYFAWIFYCLLNLCLQILFDKNIILKDAIFSLRNNVVYTLPFVLIIFSFTNKRILDLYNLILRSGTVIYLFAIVQFVARGSLPAKLLSLNVENAATLYGSDIVRVNGLMGNSIIFGGYAIVLIALAFSKIVVLKEHTFEAWIEFIIPVVANALTFSRASNVGTIIVCLLVFLLSSNPERSQDFTKRLIIAIILSLILFFIVMHYFGNTILMQRLLGTNQSWTQGSDEVHFSTIRNGIKVIEENWAIGYGMGTVGYASSLGSRGIVRDGALWIWLLEFGIPLSIFYLTLIIRFFHQAFVKRKQSILSMSLYAAFIAMSVYLLGFSIINSAYSARSVYSYWWLVAGMVIAADNENEDDGQYIA